MFTFLSIYDRHNPNSTSREPWLSYSLSRFTSSVRGKGLSQRYGIKPCTCMRAFFLLITHMHPHSFLQMQNFLSHARRALSLRLVLSLSR